jgi:hypothetical protein
MGYLPRKQNNTQFERPQDARPQVARPQGATLRRLVIPLFLALFVLLFLQEAFSAIREFERDADVDISMGTFNYFFNPSDRAFEESQGRTLPEIDTGIYFGAYLSARSKLFTFFFNTKNFYSMYEAGVALNMIGKEETFVLSIPLTVDLAYRVPVSKRVAIFPFAGTGIDFVRTSENDRYTWQFYYLIEMGIELKYSVWRNTYLKFRINYGLIFIDNLESGYMHTLKVRFPVPFLP